MSGATIRGIAASAGVDPALVRHYLGSKERLFVAAMAFPIDPAVMVPRLVEPGLDGLGERLICRFFLATWDAALSPFVAPLRCGSRRTSRPQKCCASSSPARSSAGSRPRSILIGRGSPALAASHLVGLAFVRYVVRLEPVASANAETLVREVGPTIQRYFTPG